MSAANQLPHLMTVAEFLAWQPPDGSERWELVEGIPRAMNAPSDRHAVIHGEVLRLIGNHLADARPDCRVGIGSGLRPNDYNYRIPDLAVACGPAATDNGSLRAPVLVIEILSPSNEKDTWANVAIYTTIPSIQEILVIELSGDRGPRAAAARRGGVAAADPEQARRHRDAGERRLHRAVGRVLPDDGLTRADAAGPQHARFPRRRAGRRDLLRQADAAASPPGVAIRQSVQASSRCRHR